MHSEATVTETGTRIIIEVLLGEKLVVPVKQKLLLKYPLNLIFWL